MLSMLYTDPMTALPCTCCVVLCPADSQLRQAQADHDAAEKKLAELKAEKERVNRQVGWLCAASSCGACGLFLSGWL